MTLQFGVKIIVHKIRKIYFIEHVKFHFDIVDNLGSFIEVEVIDTNGEFTIEQLKQQCDHYLKIFELSKDDLIGKSYSDLIETEKNKDALS